MIVRDVPNSLNVDEKVAYRSTQTHRQRGSRASSKISGTWRLERDHINPWFEKQKKAEGQKEGRE